MGHTISSPDILLIGLESRRDYVIIDDCTNIHFEKDLISAKKFLGECC